MGAMEFESFSFGKTAQEAFNTATMVARHEDGHGGYTGTIAEKSSYAEIELPKGLNASTVDKIVSAAQGYLAAGDEYYDFKKGKYVTLKKSNVPAALRKHESIIARLGRLSNNKWGPASCIKAPASTEKKYREQYGLRRKKGNLFIFFGLASC